MSDAPSSEHQLHQTTLPFFLQAPSVPPRTAPRTVIPTATTSRSGRRTTTISLVGGGPGGLGGGGGPIGPYDGDFKKGRFNPKLVLAFPLIVIGWRLFRDLRSEERELQNDRRPDRCRQEEHLRAPQADRVVKWRELAAKTDEYELQQEALIQLGWEGDKAAIPLAINALGQIDHRIRGVAAQVLAYFGSPDGDSGEGLAAEGVARSRRLGSPADHLGARHAARPARVRQGDGPLPRRAPHQGAAPRRRPGVQPRDDRQAGLARRACAAGIAGDEKASRCGSSSPTSSRATRRRSTPTRSSSSSRTRSSTSRAKPPSGSARSPTPRRAAPLLDALAKADKDNRQKFLEALRDGIGGEGLVLALGSVVEGQGRDDLAPEQAALRHAAQDRRSPRGQRARRSTLGHQPAHPLGDRGRAPARRGRRSSRGAHLASRMRLDPLKLYSDTNDYERCRSATTTSASSRRACSPTSRSSTPKRSPTSAPRPRTPSIFWLHDKPEPHANGLRFLAAADSTKDIQAMRKWANPSVPLPERRTAAALPREWEIAQSALATSAG